VSAKVFGSAPQTKRCLGSRVSFSQFVALLGIVVMLTDDTETKTNAGKPTLVTVNNGSMAASAFRQPAWSRRVLSK
jgi:hypothetical protein